MTLFGVVNPSIALRLYLSHLAYLFDLSGLCGMRIHGKHCRFFFLCLSTTNAFFAFVLLGIRSRILILFLSHLSFRCC